jgi:hypothetical protein
MAEFLDDSLQRLDAAQKRAESCREKKRHEQQKHQENLGSQAAGDDGDQHADQKHGDEIGNDGGQQNCLTEQGLVYSGFLEDRHHHSQRGGRKDQSHHPGIGGGADPLQTPGERAGQY